MKLKYTQIFETRSYGRSISDEGWEKIEPEHIAVWKSPIKLLSRRSLIVHGGFEIAHPMHNEFLDKRVQENYERISEVTDYALTT